MLNINVNCKRGDFTLQVSAQLSAPITGILGASGSGKSTLLSLIAGLIRPQQGSIELDGRVLCNTQSNVWVPAHKRSVGLVFQDNQLFPHLSVQHNLCYGYNNIPPEKRKFEVQTVVNLLDIEHLLARKPNTLSGGEKQRVALGRAILYSPSLLLLDEPLSALDERLKHQILPFFLEIEKEFGIPMIYVSHSQYEIDFLTDTQLTMSDGNLLNA